MGADVHGNKPRSEVGDYFRANIFQWFPLARFIKKVAPEIAMMCEAGQGWFFNNGYGIDDSAAIKLADILDAEIAAGRASLFDCHGDPLGDDFVPAFVAFLRDCGGFSIR